MSVATNPAFDPEAFLANAGLGRRIVDLKGKETFFSQGDATDSVFYLQKGRARLTVVSQNGKEATITLLSAGDFVGEECIAAVPGLRLATATAVNNCSALKIGRDEMIRVMHEEPAFADLFMKFLLARSMRTQADLVDQLFNSSEKRLARILLLMAEFGKPGETRDLYSSHYPGDARGHDRHHPIPRQLLHESLSQAWLHQLQRPHPGPQVPAQCRPARSTARPQRRQAADYAHTAELIAPHPLQNRAHRDAARPLGDVGLVSLPPRPCRRCRGESRACLRRRPSGTRLRCSRRPSARRCS